MKLFGKNYEEFGSSDNDLILKTRGKIKIQWGNKLVDLLDKDGNLNVKIPKSIKDVSSEELIDDDGIYRARGRVIASIDGEQIDLTSQADWYLTDKTKQDYIKNKPTKLSLFINDVGFFTPELLSLAGYALKSELFSGSYNDLRDKPIIPKQQILSDWNLINTTSLDYIKNKPTLFTWDYNDLNNKPELFSGDYDDLLNKPALFSGSYTDLTNKPTLFSGSYNDLTDKPTIPSLSGYATENWVSGILNDILGINASEVSELVAILDDNDLTTGLLSQIATKANRSELFSGSYTDLTDKPSIPSNVSDLTNDTGYITGMTILSYGTSTWLDFINAYNTNRVVYCRASSNANPATGNQTRLAFMAYVNSSTPTEVEFLYYRSVSSHSITLQGDLVYVYKLKNNNTWSVIVREAMSKIATSGISANYNNGVITLTGQETLVSGTNIKTINNESLLGSGNISTIVQSDWDLSDSTAADYILNKPTSLPASDVYDWAKASTKPSYTLDEVSDGTTRKLANYLSLSGGTISNSTNRAMLILNYTEANTKNGPYIAFLGAGTNRGYVGYYGDGTSNYTFLLTGSTNVLFLDTTAGSLRVGTASTNYKVWHAGNDGSNSGLDADLLDGQHGSYYATAASLTNYLPLSGGILSAKNQWLNPAKLLLLRSDTTIYTDRSCIGTTDGNLHLDAYKDKGLYLNYYSSGGNVYFNGSTYYINGGQYNGNAATATIANSPYGFSFSDRSSNDWSDVTGTFITDWHHSSGADIMFKYNGGALNVITDGYFYQGRDYRGASYRVLDEYDISHTKWGDADTVDGYHASSFSKYVPTRTKASTGTAPCSYMWLCRIGNTKGYTSLQLLLRIVSRYDFYKEARLNISTGLTPYGSTNASSLSGYILGVDTAKLYFKKTIVTDANVGCDYYDIYTAMGSWNTFDWDIQLVGTIGGMYIEYKETLLNSLPDGCSLIGYFSDDFILKSGGTMSGELAVNTIRSTAGHYNYASDTDGNLAIGTTSSAHTITLRTTSSANELHIDSNGNVGIGTASPAYKLDVSGTINATGNIRILGNNSYLGTGSGSQCHMQYDSTNKCIKFLFD